MPYGYASGVVHDGQHVAAQVRTWMVCYSCGTRQPNARECASCGNVDELRIYSSVDLRDPGGISRWEAELEVGVSMRMKDQGEDRIDE